MTYSRGLKNEEEFKEKALRTWCETQALKLRKPGNTELVVCGQQKRCVKRDFGLRPGKHVLEKFDPVRFCSVLVSPSSSASCEIKFEQEAQSRKMKALEFLVSVDCLPARLTMGSGGSVQAFQLTAEEAVDKKCAVADVDTFMSAGGFAQVPSLRRRVEELQASGKAGAEEAERLQDEAQAQLPEAPILRVQCREAAVETALAQAGSLDSEKLQEVAQLNEEVRSLRQAEAAAARRIEAEANESQRLREEVAQLQEEAAVETALAQAGSLDSEKLQEVAQLNEEVRSLRQAEAAAARRIEELERLREAEANESQRLREEVAQLQEEVDVQEPHLYFTLRDKPAILEKTADIPYHGHIKREEGLDCYLSFPGKYAAGWDALIKERHGQSVACVFLCTPADGLGKHYKEEFGGQCYCPTIYGQRDFRIFGYLKELPASCSEAEEKIEVEKAKATKTVVVRSDASDKDKQEAEEKARQAWEDSGRVASWGCEWSHTWKKQVAEAVRIPEKPEEAKWTVESQTKWHIFVTDRVRHADLIQVCSQANRHFGRTFKAMAGLFKAMLAVLALCCGGEMNRDDDGQWFVQCRVYCILLTVVSAVSQWCQQFQFTGRRNSPETPEQKLLQGLQILLKDTLQASSSGASNKKGKGKGSGKSSGKSLPSKQRDANHDGSYGLIQALQKLTARAAKKPQGLPQRLKTLVQVTERGMLRPNKRKKDLPPHEAVPPVKPSTRFKSSENLVDGAPKPKTRWQRDRSWKARAQDWGVKTVLRGPTALCNALDSGDTGALLCQVQNLDDWNEALQISHAAGRTNVTVVLEAAPNMSPELGKLRYHGWTALNTRAAGYADDKLVQRLVWIARCSPNAPTLVPGSVLTGFARVKGKDRALQLIKASGSEHKGQVWFLDPARWDGLAETPPRMLWVDKLENEQQIAFARRVAHDSGPFGMARGRVQLALRVKPDDERLKPTSSVWRVETVPFGWDFENVEETLVEAGFSEIDILAKQRRRGGTAWVFKGMRNDDRDQMQIHYDADETCNDDRGNEAMDVSLISVPDASDVEDEPMHVQGTKRKDQAMLTSPQKTGHDKKRMKVPERLQKVPNPGEGNCLFYCLAQAESTPGKSRSHRQVRAFVVAYMTKHFKKYEDFWDGLSPSNIPMEGGFDDYLQALEKDKAWAGYCEIEAYGEAMRRPVLVVHAKDNVVHAFNSHGDKDVVCLWYKDEHYELIVPSDADIQALWQNAEDGGTKGYRGAAKKARLAADNASICLSQFATPKSSRPSPRLTDFAQSTPAKRSACLTDFASTAKPSRQKTEQSEAEPCGSNPSAASASASVATGRDREITWTCHICNVSFTDKACIVSKRRTDHIRRTHRGTPTTNFKKAVDQYRAPVTAVSYGPTHAAVSWTCGFCMGTLPILPKTHQKASIVAHLRSCAKAPKGATRGDSILRLCKRASVSSDVPHRSILPWKLKHRQMYVQLNKFAKEQGHSLSQVQRRTTGTKKLAGGSKKVIFFMAQHACSICAGYWKTEKSVRAAGPCGGRTARAEWLAMPGRQKCWRQAPKERQEALHKAWRLSATERRKLDDAWASAKKKSRKKWPPKSWKRDLTAENIHPHPGPGHPDHWILSWNCRGSCNAWRGLNLLQDEGNLPSVLCLQEPDFEPRQGSQYVERLQKLGYKCWTIPAKPIRTLKREFYRGGLLVALREHLRGGIWDTLACDEGYVMTLDLQSCLLSSVWRRPSQLDGLQFLEYVATVTEEAQRRQIPALWVGDWNETPDDNAASIFLNGSVLAVTDPDQWVPSRFEGKRCLDYGILSGGYGFADCPRYSECKISDHKMFWLRLRLPIFQTDTWRFAWRPNYECPPEVPVEQWRAVLAEQWAAYVPCFSQDPDQDWEYFHQFAEKSMREALHLCGQPVPRPGHARGNLPRVIKAERPQVNTFPARKLVNVLGRLYEVKRQLAKSQGDKKLLQKLWSTWPSEYNELWGSWNHAIEVFEQRIALENRKSKNQRLTEWRTRMRQGGKEVTRWMKPHKPPTPRSVSEDSCATITQTLDCIRSFWQRIWKREDLVPHLPPEFRTMEALAGPQTDWMPDAALIYQAALRASGSAAGCDGWSGSEVCHFPLVAWDHYRDLVLHWSQLKQFPQAWLQVRQVHLRKDDSGTVGSLRPIAVESIFLRLVSSSYVRTPQVQEWIASRVPEQCHGGLKSRGVATAWRQLNEAFENQEVLASLDFSKCFDFVHPGLAIENMQLQGLPDEWANILMFVWGHQVRWLCLGKAVHPTPEHVQTSMPQGDAFAPLALIMLLIRPLHDVSSIPDLRQVAYVDDRALSAPNVPRLIAGIHRWRSWSATLGLHENVQKMRLVACTAQQKQEINDAGFGEYLRPATRVLGIDFKESDLIVSPVLENRLQEAVFAAHRLQKLPVDRDIRMSLYRSRIISLATWGAWFERLPQSQLPSLRKAWHAISYLQGNASRPLFNLLVGHMYHAEFWATMSSIRTMRQVRAPWRRMPRPGGWQSFICARMRELNWEFRGPWMFAHEDLGHVDLSNPDEAVVKLTEHKVRESWRRVQFALWKKQNRRDRHYLLDVPYEESRVSDARKLFSLTCDSHQRAVMLGSAHSTACYDKMRGHEVREQCPFCGEQIPPVWEHLSWHCSAEQLSSGRPEVPEDDLQNRLAWPTRGCDAYDRAVLHHMARTFEAAQCALDKLRNNPDGQVFFLAPSIALGLYFVRWLAQSSSNRGQLHKLLRRIVLMEPQSQAFLSLRIKGDRFDWIPLPDSKKRFLLTIIDEAHNFFCIDENHTFLEEKIEAPRQVLLLSSVSQNSSGAVHFPPAKEISLTQVVRSTKRIVAGAAAFQASVAEKEQIASLCPAGPPLKAFLFESDAHVFEDYAKHTVSALFHVMRIYAGLSFHNRLALLVPNPDFLEKFQDALQRHFKTARLAGRNFKLISFTESLRMLPNVKVKQATHADNAELIVLDTVENAKGLESLMVVCIGLDQKVGDQSANQVGRSNIYQAITRAQLQAVIVNQLLRGGWLEFLGVTKFKSDTFNESTAMAETTTAAAEALTKVQLPSKLAIQASQEDSSRREDARAIQRGPLKPDAVPPSKPMLEEGQDPTTAPEAGDKPDDKLVEIKDSSVWDADVIDIKEPISQLQFDPRSPTGKAEEEVASLEAEEVREAQEAADAEEAARCQGLGE
ncbi:unnamed protein product, partial [Cladocopium goreaui]